MPTSTTKVDKPAPPTFSFIQHTSKPGPSPGGGGLFHLCINEKRVCDVQHWGFASCGVDLWQNFKGYQYEHREPIMDKLGRIVAYRTNFDVLDEHHEALFEWLKSNVVGNDGWNPKETLICLSSSQIRCFPKMLNHPYVKAIDRWVNKSHGPHALHLYRISLTKDFK